MIARTLWLIVVVGDGECLMNSSLRQNDVAHPIGSQNKPHRIGNALQFLERFRRLRSSALAFKGEGQSGKSDNQRPVLVSHLHPRHGAAPEPVPPPSSCTDENHSRALHRFAQFVGGFRAAL
jgi:hypothetical protein